MTPYPKHYLADVPHDLRLRLLDLCARHQWHDALDLLHQSGFTKYEWYELTWFYWHAPTNLDRTASGPPASEHGIPPETSRSDLSSGGPLALTPLNLNANRTANPEPLALMPRRESCGVAVKDRSVKVKRRKPRSKACRLPKDIQDNLNTLLADGRPYADIIRFLNDRGYPGFNKVNLHNWRITGFRNWLVSRNSEVNT